MTSAPGTDESTRRRGGAFEAAEPSLAWILGGYGLPQTIDPARQALVWDGGTRTYAELRSNALALAAAMRDRGLVDGDRVVSHLFNRGEILELYFACAVAGLTLSHTSRMSDGSSPWSSSVPPRDLSNVPITSSFGLSQRPRPYARVTTLAAAISARA